jgi:AAA+ superfamily predicted ATPase
MTGKTRVNAKLQKLSQKTRKMSHKNRRGKIWKTARLSEKEMHRVKQT